MPGIAGIISKKSLTGKNEKDVRVMVDCMMHEPFYTSGVYVDRTMGIYVGWVNHKGSFSDCMPVYNKKKDTVLIFIGENFANSEIADQLKKKGFQSDYNDASYLMHLYQDDDAAFLKNLNGWFSGALVDLRTGQV